MSAETRGATERQETLILMLNKTAEPFTDGIARRLVATCSGLDAVLDRVGNQIMAESEFRIRGADHSVVWCRLGKWRSSIGDYPSVTPEVRQDCPLE